MIFEPTDQVPTYAPTPPVLLPDPGDVDPRDEHYRLALESAQRWLNNYRLSPAMRLRALRSVVQSALADG